MRRVQTVVVSGSAPFLACSLSSGLVSAGLLNIMAKMLKSFSFVVVLSFPFPYPSAPGRQVDGSVEHAPLSARSADRSVLLPTLAFLPRAACRAGAAQAPTLEAAALPAPRIVLLVAENEASCGVLTLLRHGFTMELQFIRTPRSPTRFDLLYSLEVGHMASIQLP